LDGRPRTGSGNAGGTDLDVAAGGEFVEMMAGHIGMQLEMLGGLGGRHTFGAAVGVEVDIPACRVTEGALMAVTALGEVGTRGVRG
jgi:hypothetical protein